MSLSATNAGTTKPPPVFGLWMLKHEGDSIRFYLKYMIVKLSVYFLIIEAIWPLGKYFRIWCQL